MAAQIDAGIPSALLLHARAAGSLEIMESTLHRVVARATEGARFWLRDEGYLRKASMNRASLGQKLQQAGIRRDAYSLTGAADEAYVLEEDGETWAVYYSERGLRSGLRQFGSESEACDYLYELLSRDPAAVRTRTRP